MSVPLSTAKAAVVTLTISSTALRLLASNLAQQSTRRTASSVQRASSSYCSSSASVKASPRCFSTYRPYLSTGRRNLQTASALKPQGLEMPPSTMKGGEAGLGQPLSSSPSKNAAPSTTSTPSAPPRNTFDAGVRTTEGTGDARSIVREGSKEEKVVEEKVQQEKNGKEASSSSTSTSPSPSSSEPAKRPRQFKFAPRKATIKLSPTAVSHVRQLLDQPEPKLLRIGTKNKGCSGLAYSLEYVDKPGKFDETVEQDGVKVLIESRTLLHIIGSEMDWVEDKLSARFVFKNPNITEQCGCGESFSIS